MALSNGLLVHGPRHWAAAVALSGGAVRVASGRKLVLPLGPFGRVPVLRGVARVGEALAVVPAVRRALPDARLPMEGRATVVAAVGAVVAGAIARRRIGSPLGQEVAAALVGAVPGVVMMRSSQVAAWHAVEHKSIAAFEAGGVRALGRADVHPKEHRRCGSNLVLPLMVLGVAGNLATRAARRMRIPLPRTLVAGACVGGAVEVFAFAVRNPRHPVARVVHGAGHAVQVAVATREPTAHQLAVGRRAMEALIEAETGRTR